MVKFLDLNKQYQSIKVDIDNAIASVIAESAYIGGRFAKSFEENFAAYQNARFCVGVGNGTDALEIAIEALNLKPGSEIIVPANSFIASAEAVTRAGHKVVFCDCDPDDYTISVEDMKRRIGSRTAAVIAVHLYGHPCDMDSIKEVADEYGLKIIEDCAQSHGAEYKGQRVGAIGDIGTFSFYPGKNLGAYGDGGAIVTNSEELVLKCRMIANHGRLAKYNHEFEGRNSRLDGLQAAILDVKLKFLDSWLESRIQIAQFYNEKLCEHQSIVLPLKRDWARHVYHLFVIRTKKRDELREYLKKRDVQSGIHYPIALPKLSAYRYIDQGRERMLANEFDSELLSLPIGEHLTTEDAKKVAEAVISFLNLSSS